MERWKAVVSGAESSLNVKVGEGGDREVPVGFDHVELMAAWTEQTE